MITDFVGKGGSLLSTFETGSYDTSGKARGDFLLGLITQECVLQGHVHITRVELHRCGELIARGGSLANLE